jgi:hypothetical protein
LTFLPCMTNTSEMSAARALHPYGCPILPGSRMGLLGAAPQRETPNIGRKFREPGLIELVAAIVQNPHCRMREDTPITLQMLERGVGVVPAVIQIDRR